MPIRSTDIFDGVIPSYQGKGLLLGWKAANSKVNGGEPVYETVVQFESFVEREGVAYAITPQAQEAVAAINEQHQP